MSVPEERELAQGDIDALYEKLKSEAEAGAYHLNPDVEFTKELVQGLIENTRRYGYASCPCRLAKNDRRADLDIVCPCYYRDQDLNDHDACYCALYVTRKVLRGEKEPGSIPERRNSPMEKEKEKRLQTPVSVSLALPVWRCQVCGYLCAREEPPEQCPICKAEKERFHQFV